VAELQGLLPEVPREGKIVLLGHSRGGLIARKYLQDRRLGWDRVSGVVFLGTPHHGSGLAKIGQLLAAAIAFWGNLRIPRRKISPNGIGAAEPILNRLASYGHEEGVAELVPGSPFLRRLLGGERQEMENKIPYCNLIGTRTDFIRIYLRAGPKGSPKPVFSLFDGFERVLPGGVLPAEIRQGRGDGQVSVDSSRLIWLENTRLFPVNHARFLVDSAVQNAVGKFLKAV
jgi:pimeloyl-ACP methyl ester carboxylesterase